MPRLGFKMASKDDLSARADFSFDLMQSLGKAVNEAIESSQEISELKQKAIVHVTFSGSLRAVDISIKIDPLPGAEISEEETAAFKEKVGNLIGETVQSKLSELVQQSMNSTRARM